jgi:hypothetical protein
VQGADFRRDDSGGPPRPPLHLCVGVTGHRALDPAVAAALPGRIGAVLDDIAAITAATAQAERAIYAPAAPCLTFLAQLAIGADQIAAAEALDRGYALHAILPLASAEFRHDFDPAALKDFDRLLGRATACWSLPGRRTEADAAYAMAGEATAAQCDVLIAVWDGAPARGSGGTAEVVDYAVRRGVPVIHLPVDDRPPRLLWSGFEGLPPSLYHRDNVPRRALDAAVLEEVLQRLLLPDQERGLLSTYLAERERRWRFRFEFPLLLAVAGVRRITPAAWRAPGYAARVGDDWTSFRATLPAIRGLDFAQEAFGWADGLADHYAQLYRSGMIFNFVAAAGAVLLALTGFVLPETKLLLTVMELVIVAALIVNTRIGTRQEWHRRWLDYRLLAEQLRTVRSLKLFSLSRPQLDPLEGGGDQEMWTHWYAAAAWRQIGAPPTIGSDATVAALADHVATRELDDQIAYHTVNAHRMHVLEHRLHRFGAALFTATAAIGIVVLAGKLLEIEPILRVGKVLGIMTAALPTIGSAVFGIRGAGDFAGAAARSERTAHRLREIAARLRRAPLGLADAARATEEASTTMLRDLREWRSAYRNRVLAIPA